MVWASLSVFLVILSVGVNGQPASNSGGPGYTDSVNCTAGVTTCSRSGASNYMARYLTYNSSTGFFSGSFTSNSCPEFQVLVFNGVPLSSSLGPTYSAACYSQPIPAQGYTDMIFPKAVPLRGTAGFTISGGSDIYGSMENGFTLGQACTNQKGSCPAGCDVPTCEAKLKQECGLSNFNEFMFGDDCGGHATPYHFHTDIKCTKSGYSGQPITGVHSPLIGVMLDGRGLYGQYESGSTRPTDLDACGGHKGPVPATTVSSNTNDTYPAATSVYHYHTQPVAPYVPGCFGPVTSLAACKALYSKCSTGTPGDFCTTLGEITYQYDCPCFQNMPTNETFNQVFTLTSTCGGSAGAAAHTTLSSLVYAGLTLLIFLRN